jgi:hypothetical protein
LGALLFFEIGYTWQKILEYPPRLAQEKFQKERIRKRPERTQEVAHCRIKISQCHGLNKSIFESLNFEEITRACRITDEKIEGERRHCHFSITYQ